MQIISGFARNVILECAVSMEVRPTSGRARKALFDSIGNFSELKVADFFSGSGALGLESASRGAIQVLMVEKNPLHAEIIRRNIQKVQKTGVRTDFKVLNCDVLNVPAINHAMTNPDLIFADPPYHMSVEIFQKLCESLLFNEWASRAKLIWEIPDVPGAAGNFIRKDFFSSSEFRRFGSTMFLIATLK